METLNYWQPNDATVNEEHDGLVGTKFTLRRTDGRVQQVEVGGCDPYIGLSLLKTDQEGNKIIALCLHGPFDPGTRKKFLENEDWQNEWHGDFVSFCRCVKEAKKTGVLWEDDLNRLNKELGGGKTEAVVSAGLACPFGV